MNWQQEKETFFENYKKLREQNTTISLKDCMSPEMLQEFEIEKSNVLKNSIENYEIKKFNYDSLIENKNIANIAEIEEFKYPNYLLDYDFEFASEKLQNAIITFLNEKLPTFWKEDPFVGTVTLNSLCLDDAKIVVYNDHMEFIVDSDIYRFCIRLVIKDNEACLLNY